MNNAILPCTIHRGIVNGPSGKLSDNNISYYNTRARVRNDNVEIKKHIEQSKRKSENTPAAVKIAGIGAVIAIIAGLLKLKLKK